MKKAFLIFFTLALFCAPVCAEVFKARTLNSFSTKNPPSELVLKAMSDMTLDELQIQKDYILHGDFVDFVPPQNWGKNATFSIKLTSYVDLTGQKHQISKGHVIKYRQKMKPNWRRQSFSFMGSSDGGRSSSGITFSPYDIDIIKESTSVGDFLVKEAIKNSVYDKGWDLDYHQNEVIYFNY